VVQSGYRTASFDRGSSSRRYGVLLAQGSGTLAAPAFAVSLTAILVSLATSLFIWSRNRKEVVSQFLSGLWNDTLQSCIDNPKFVEVVGRHAG
jgi:hypothetical protein